jgi:hypothetical protein
MNEMIMSKTTVFAHIRACGHTYARAFPKVTAARRFLMSFNGASSITAMRIEIRMTGDYSDNVEWSEALDEALHG